MCATRSSRQRRQTRQRRYSHDGTWIDYSFHLEDRLAQLEKRNAELEEELGRTRSQSAQSMLSTPDEGSDGGSDLTFRIETVESQRAANQAPASSNQMRQDKHTTVRFISQMPTSESEWSKRRQATKLSTPKEIFDFFQILTLSSPVSTSPLPFSGLARSASETIEAYHQLVGYSNQLRNYSLLVFFCVCLVALRRSDVTIETIDKLTIGLLGDKKENSYLTRLRQAAGSMACVIEILEATLGRAGSMLLLLYCPSMSIYRKPARGSKTPEELAHQILEKTSWLRGHDDVSVSFSPAFLIASSGQYSVDDINKALGTKISKEDYARRRQRVECEKAKLRPGKETVSGRPNKRQKTQWRDASFQHAASLEQEATRVEGERSPSFAHSDQSAPTDSETLSAHGDSYVLPQNDMLSPLPSSAVGVSTPDHAVEAVTSGSKDNTDSSNGAEGEQVSQDQQPRLNLQQNIEPHDTAVVNFFSDLNAELNTYQFEPWNIFLSPGYD